MNRRVRWTVAAVAAFVLLGAELGIRVSSGPQGSSELATHTYRFVPVAVSFVTPSRGFELGSLECRACAVLRLTRDGGRTWQTLPAPALYIPLDSRKGTAVSDVVFDGSSDGWLFGPGLYATQDGGRTWTRQGLPPVVSVQASGGFVYVLTATHGTGGVTIFRSPVGSDRWQRLTTPPLGKAGAEVVVSRSSVLLLRAGWQGPGPGNRGALWFSASRGRTWRSRPVPCRHEGGAAAVAAVGPRRWLLECFSNEQSSQEQRTLQRLFLSADDGGSWRELAVPTHEGEPVALAGACRHFLLGAESGGVDELVGSFDGGRSWRVLLSHAGFLGWGDLRFLTARVGFVVGPNRGGPGFATHNRVYRTDDGGRRWHVVGQG